MQVVERRLEQAAEEGNDGVPRKLRFNQRFLKDNLFVEPGMNGNLNRSGFAGV